MSEKKDNIISHSMRSGLITGLLLSACFFLSLASFYVNNAFLSLCVNFLWIFIPLYCFFRFTKKFNMEVQNNNSSYISALAYGFYLFFFASMIIALLAFLFFQFIYPDSLQQLYSYYLQEQEEMLMQLIQNQSDLSGKLAKTAEDMLEKSVEMTPADAALNILWGFSFLGFFISLIMAFFFRKKKNADNNVSQN